MLGIVTTWKNKDLSFWNKQRTLLFLRWQICYNLTYFISHQIVNIFNKVIEFGS